MFLASTLRCKMGRCKDRTTTEKQIIIVTHLRSGMSTLQMVKVLKRDHRTVKKAADNILYKRKRKKRKNLRIFLIETYGNLRQLW